MEKEGNDFGVELPDEIDPSLTALTVTDKMLANGAKLADMKLPNGTLVMIIKRGSDYIVPNGSIELQSSDKLLLISDSSKDADSEKK